MRQYNSKRHGNFSGGLSTLADQVYRDDAKERKEKEQARALAVELDERTRKQLLQESGIGQTIDLSA